MSDKAQDRVAGLRETLADVESEMSDPSTHDTPGRFQELAIRHGELKPIVEAADAVASARESAEQARELAADLAGDEQAEWLAEAEAADARAEKAEATLSELLAPKDPDDDRDVILEIRSAAGGDEAGLFAGELATAYETWALAKGWKFTPLEVSEQDVGGISAGTYEINGRGAFALLKHESGVHRVQRVPATESSGRIHTSTASVAVLPVAEEVDIQINPNDLRIDVYRSSGPGGQSVNTTDSAVRITHEPTGITVSCQDEKSQHKNKAKALRILASRLQQLQREEAMQSRADARRVQIGSGDRSEKIRTYNFPQSRVTDHRIGFTAHNLAAVMAGDLDDLIDALRAAERAELLARGEEEAASKASTS